MNKFFIILGMIVLTALVGSALMFFISPLYHVFIFSATLSVSTILWARLAVDMNNSNEKELNELQDKYSSLLDEHIDLMYDDVLSQIKEVYNV